MNDKPKPEDDEPTYLVRAMPPDQQGLFPESEPDPVDEEEKRPAINPREPHNEPNWSDALEKSGEKLRVVNFSGGACSFFEATRVIEKHGRKNVVLLFADTLVEDCDLYRFLKDAEKHLSVRVTKIAEGRTPWEVCEKERFIANSRVDPCSKYLKRDLLFGWIKKNCNSAQTVLHFGLDWTEQHRLDKLRARYAEDGWRVAAYMTQPPYLQKEMLLARLEAEGIKPPRLYAMGFKHNNCGGFCFKAGQAQFENLLRTMPERYKDNEKEEERLRAILGDYSILKRQRNGKRENLTLKQFREELERQPDMFDAHDWGGCGCAVD